MAQKQNYKEKLKTKIKYLRRNGPRQFNAKLMTTLRQPYDNVNFQNSLRKT